MQYRPEVDGLRAVAVLPVIFFHAGFEYFSGGYVGVDIFFVISGYLITTIICEEIAQQKFSIVKFYERRARRILPALFLVLIFTTIAALMLMPAELLKSYAQSLISVLVFGSNVFFYFTNDYFSTAADEKPLLHTWSLAVEEQYYLFFPILLMFCWSWGKRKLFVFLSVICVLSLMFAELLLFKQRSEASFYLIFSRAWELFAGSLIAFLGPQGNKVKKGISEVASIAGILMIAIAIVTYDKHTPFPGVYALVPVLGTCLYILYATPESLVGRILSSKVPVYIGLVSYSLYLWHQPLFAFLRLKTVGEPPIMLFWAGIAATFLFAHISWKYVEAPFRDKKRYSQLQVFKLSAIAIFAGIGVGFIGVVNDGFEGRFSQSPYSASVQHSPKRDECHTRGASYLKPENACQYFKEDVTWAVFGDSHLVEPGYALAQRLSEKEQGLLHLSFSGCPPLLETGVSILGCNAWLEESLAYLTAHPSIEHVLLGFRHAAYLYGDQLESYPHVPDESLTRLFIDNQDNLTSQQARERYWESFANIVEQLTSNGKKVYLLYPIPELSIHIEKAITPLSIFSSSPMVDLEKVTSKEYYLLRNAEVVEKLDEIVRISNVEKVQIADEVCSNGYCKAVDQEASLYFDDDHLSLHGSELIVDALEKWFD